MLSLPPFGFEGGCNALLPAPGSVTVVCIDAIRAQLSNGAEPSPLQPNRLFKPVSLVEGSKTKVFDEVAAANLQLVNLGPEFYGLVLLTSHDGVQIGLVQTHDAVRNGLFWLVEVVSLLLRNTSNRSDLFKYPWFYPLNNFAPQVEQGL